MKRLFVFGCSRTKWKYWMWPDIIAHDQEWELFNYGMPGVGNVAIQHKMMQAKIHHNITDEDVVGVYWSFWAREDRVYQYLNSNKDPVWLAEGNVFNIKKAAVDYLKEYGKINNQRALTPKFVEQWWNEEWDVIKNCTAILSANDSLQINFQASLQDIDMLYPQAKKYGTMIPDMHYVMADDNLYKGGLNHGTLIQHGELAEKLLKQKLKPSTWDWMNEKHELLLEHGADDIDDYFERDWNYDAFIPNF